MSKTDQLKEFVQSLDGYRISDTHFKIGSKVHSSDFIYAKRLFQNSYYTARIALDLAIKIKAALVTNDINSLTLVGYELYSELLLSLIKKFLRDFGFKNIDHFVIADLDEDIKYFPPDMVPRKNAVIIVPIASTGTTAIKIEEFIKDKYPQTIFITPHYNIILAADKSDGFSDIIEQTQKQRSFIQLNVTWQNPADCEWCFDNQKSRPLFETDKSSLTPALIFDKPLAKRDDSFSPSSDFDKITFDNALIYRKAKRNNEHFLFSTKTDFLIEKNEPAINKWLDKIKKELNIHPTDKVVIISPCHYSNTTFINLVNDKLFHSSATIIHHQTGVDYLSNFRLLNYKYLKQKDAKIFFVDDSLISGGTFFRIYDLLRYTLDYVEELTGAILLSDKSSPDIHKRVSRAAKKIYSFIKVNLPMHPKVYGKRPLEHEIKKYDDLSQMVLHDVLKKIFYVKSFKVSGEEVSEEIINENKELVSDEERKKVNEEKEARHLKMFKSTHKIYEFYQNTNDIQKVSFNDLLKSCGFDEKDVEDKMSVMKVLSQYPFLLYKPVWEKTFEWHKEWLDTKMKELSGKLNTYNGSYIFTYNEFCELKFLIRRSVFLGNNRILQPDFFNLISTIFKKIIAPESIKKEVAAENNKNNSQTDLFNKKGSGKEKRQVDLLNTEKENVKDFHIFLLKQYVEIVQKNGWCAVKCIKSIKQTENNFETLKGKQFIRMLKLEVAAVLNDFYSILHREKDWKELYKFQTDENGNKTKVKKIEPDEENEKIINYLNKNGKFLKTNKAQIALQTLGLINNPSLENQLPNYLWIKQFLNSEKHAKKLVINLTEKTDAIFYKLRNIFYENKNVGTFFIVTDGKDNPHLVYDKDSEGNRFIGELNESKHSVLYNFLRGQKTEYGGEKTIIEYEKISDNKWKDSYALENNSPLEEFSADCNWLLLIRISDSEPEVTKKKQEITAIKYKTLGLMGFYCKNKLHNDLLVKQLLMLIRKDVGEFIKRHHKNDEFSLLREEEIRNRFAYLAGHGRQMIRELASKEQIFKNVVDTMEKLQHLFATKWISPSGNTKETKEKLTHLLLSVFPTKNIDNNTLGDIISIGNLIFKSAIIDNEVKVVKNLKHDKNGSFSFIFNSDILKFICFELIINAKKNRFHFITGKCSMCQTEYNNVEIRFTNNSNKLIVELKSTGPEIDNNVVHKINSGNTDRIKQDYEVAGLNLIYKLIKALNDDNQIKINADTNKIKPCGECGIQTNTVTVELNPIE